MGLIVVLLLAASGASIDAVPSGLSEIGQMLADSGFDAAGLLSGKASASAFRVVSVSQEYGVPTPDVCCHTRTALRIGQEEFLHGIGAHANGRITLELLRPFTAFKAEVGIDNNSDTQGQRGSAVFIVEVDGKESFRSPVCRGGDAPVPVEVPLSGAKTLTLVLNDAGDGIAHDQADWAQASLVGEDETILPVSAGFDAPLLDSIPSSFQYDGKDSDAFLPGWSCMDAPAQEQDGAILLERTWTDPDTGFEACLRVRVRSLPPSFETQWVFRNGGAQPSPIIGGVRSIDLVVTALDRQVTLHSCSGGLTGHLDGAPEPTGFDLSRTPLGEKGLTVKGGRSSNGDLPFYYLTGLPGGWGLGLALGWSGQWRAEGRFDSGTERTTFTAGMEPAHFRLPPGEEVALPTALFIPFKGGVSEGVNLMRRTLREHYQARLGGEPFQAPVSFSSWFVFDNRVNESMLKELATEAAPLGIEYFCLDSGWFDGDFPEGVGNWTVHQVKFPNGLKPVADHVRGLGMKFGLWFEPERVANGTRWHREHPDWLLGGYLLDLGRPEARTLVLDMMSGIIAEAGVDWIRYDFNVDPLPAWAGAEDEESGGLVQIRYINGLYTLFEALMERFPNLLIEQCSSGGRRIDLRTIQYGHTFWKSDDTYDQPLMRFHEMGGNQFLLGSHLNTNYCRWRSEGELLALFAGPLGFGVDFRALSGEEKESIRRIVEAYKRIRPLLNEDYYALFQPVKDDPDDWCGWQFINPSSGEGCVIAYRPEDSPYTRAAVRLRGVDPEKDYGVRDLLTGKTSAESGQRLLDGYEIELEPGTACVHQFKLDAVSAFFK